MATILVATMAIISVGCSNNDKSTSTAETTVIEIETEIETIPITEKITEEITEIVTEKTTESSIITSSSEFVDKIAETLDITDKITMAAEMIGAEDGTSFMYGNNKFEIYKFSDDNPKIEEASTGTLTIQLDGFGNIQTNSSVNGNYVMIYDTPDDDVINAFLTLK